jgi:hypothetical protein
MTTRELHFYDEEALALRQRLIRRFENCTVWSAERDGAYYLLLDERARKHTTLCEYRKHTEFEEDRDYLKNLPPDGLVGGATRSLPPED